jgi:hypothetical protein
MIAQTELPGFGKATRCQASGSHNPRPMRFVWHHIQPAEAGGATVAGNLVQVCDSCHYTIHRLLWQMATGALVQPAPRQAQLALAAAGYKACVSAGTVAQVPIEG